MGKKRIPLPNKFIALDVETANSSPATICQIGLAWFEEGAIVDTWSTYVNPNCEFRPINIRIHGIKPEMVESSPCFCDIADDLRRKFSQNVIVHHTHFDRTALTQALEKHCLPDFECTWVDSSTVARRTWQKYSVRGFGIADICSDLGIDLGDHHDALSDAIACGKIFQQAMIESGISFDKWVKSVGTTYAMLIQKKENERINQQYKDVDLNINIDLSDLIEEIKTNEEPEKRKPSNLPATNKIPLTNQTSVTLKRNYKIGKWRAIIGVTCLLFAIIAFTMVSEDPSIIIMAFMFLIPAIILLLPWELWVFDQLSRVIKRS